MATQIPVGSLAFTAVGGPNVGDPAPLVYVSASDGTVLDVSPETIIGADADVLDDGRFYSELGQGYLYCPITVNGVVGLSATRGNYADRFYGVAQVGAEWAIQSVNPDGTLLHQFVLQSTAGQAGPTVAYAVAVGLNAGRLNAYHIFDPATATLAQRKAVRRYELEGPEGPATPVFAGEASRVLRTTHSILVLRNGNVLVGWSSANGGSGATNVVKLYTPGIIGTEIAAFPLSATDTPDLNIRLLSALTDDSFWVLYDDVDNTNPDTLSAVAQIRISDSAVLKHFTITNAMKAAIDAAHNVDWQPAQGGFITRSTCGDGGSGGGSGGGGNPSCVPIGSLAFAFNSGDDSPAPLVYLSPTTGLLLRTSAAETPPGRADTLDNGVVIVREH